MPRPRWVSEPQSVGVNCGGHTASAGRLRFTGDRARVASNAGGMAPPAPRGGTVIGGRPQGKVLSVEPGVHYTGSILGSAMSYVLVPVDGTAHSAVAQA